MRTPTIEFYGNGRCSMRSGHHGQRNSSFLMRIIVALLGLAPCMARADESPSTMPLDEALNGLWGGHVHCMGNAAGDWEEHWRLRNGKVSWTDKNGAQRDVSWNGHEFILSGLRGPYPIEGKAHFEGDVIEADFAFSVQLQCHVTLRHRR